MKKSASGLLDSSIHANPIKKEKGQFSRYFLLRGADSTLITANIRQSLPRIGRSAAHSAGFNMTSGVLAIQAAARIHPHKYIGVIRVIRGQFLPRITRMTPIR
ncbi:MAG: hypothetical protein M0036_09280 [Desulfobacteraceae bacterium]|nr:hypothetical protein [Desulfobacteraceae bacterium]